MRITQTRSTNEINIGDTNEYVNFLIKNKKPTFWATKTVQVILCDSHIGDVVDTIMSNGSKETTNTVKEGDVVIQNPSGERYIVPSKDFHNKYEIIAGSNNQYKSKGVKQEFICLDEDISFTSPWKSKMTIKSGGFLNITDRNSNSIYGIQQQEFESTYTRCDTDNKKKPSMHCNIL